MRVRQDSNLASERLASEPLYDETAGSLTRRRLLADYLAHGQDAALIPPEVWGEYGPADAQTLAFRGRLDEPEFELLASGKGKGKGAGVIPGTEWTQGPWFAEWVKKRRRLFGMAQDQIADSCWPSYRFIEAGYPVANLRSNTAGLANESHVDDGEATKAGKGNCTFEFDVEYTTDDEAQLERFDLEEIPGVNNPSECCKKCGEHEQCKYFSYHVFTGTCILKTPEAYMAKQVVPGYISGTTWIVNRTLFATTLEFGDICPCAPCCWGRLRSWLKMGGIGGSALALFVFIFAVTEVYRRCSGRGRYRLTDGHNPKMGELMFLITPSILLLIWVGRGFYLAFLTMCIGCHDTHLWRATFFLSTLTCLIGIILFLGLICAMTAGEDARQMANPRRVRVEAAPSKEEETGGYPPVPYYYVNSYGYVPSEDPAPAGGRDPHAMIPPPPAPHIRPVTYRQFHDQPVPLWHGGYRST
jgi:hypothetical protein